jgi:O-antigen/teichoic acid export membrane protein
LLTEMLTYLLSKILPSLLNFASMAVFSRNLGPADYGKLSLLINSANLIAIFILQWPGLSLSRFYSPYSEKSNESPKRYFFYLLFMALGVLCIGVPVGLLRDNLPTVMLAIGIASFQALFDLVLRVYNVNNRRYTFLMTSLLRSLIYLFGGLLFLYAFPEKSFITIAMANFIAYFLSSVLLFPGKHFIKAQPPSPVILKDLLIYSVPLVAANSLSIILDVADRYFLNFYHGSESTGLYAVSYDLSQFSIASIFNVIFLICGPSLFREYENSNEEGIRIQLHKILNFVGGIIIPLSFSILLFSEQLILYTSGPKFIPDNHFLVFYIVFGIVLAGIKSNYFDTILLMKKHTKAILLVNAVGVAINLLLNWLLIPHYSTVGAAAATALTFLVTFGASSYFVKDPQLIKLLISVLKGYFVQFSALFLVAAIFMLVFEVHFVIGGIFTTAGWFIILYLRNWENLKDGIHRVIKKIKAS